MANPHMAAFLYQACTAAIAKIGEADADEVMRVAANVAAFREHGLLSDAQVDGLAEGLGVEVEVPDAPDTFDAAIAALQEDVSVQGDAISEIGTILSDMLGGE